MPFSGLNRSGFFAAGSSIAVGLVADPGAPTAVSSRVSRELPGRLRRSVSDQVEWRVETVTDELPLDEEGKLDVHSLADTHRKEHGWHLVVLVTDLPRRAGTQPIVAEYSTRRGVALASVPALGGGLHMRSRLEVLLVHLVAHLAGDRLGIDPHVRLHRTRLTDWLDCIRHLEEQDRDVDERLVLVGARGRFRLLAGMVHANRPWRLVPHLVSATAAAAATAAFGIFYSTIWSMADALPPWRLAVINVVAVLAMVLWLLAYNHLWDRPSEHARPGEALLYNLSSVLTLAIGVASMYVMLYGLALLAAAAVIEPGYLQTQLRHQAKPADYATLVWLACSMGIVAGALGSSLDSEQAVRQATYSRREQERQARNRARTREGPRRLSSRDCCTYR